LNFFPAASEIYFLAATVGESTKIRLGSTPVPGQMVVTAWEFEN